MSARGRWLTVVMVVLLVKTVFFMWLAPIMTPDSYVYDQLATNIVNGHGYSLSREAPFRPDATRPPLYPFLLAILYGGLGAGHISVVLLQYCLGLTSALYIYLMTRRYGKTVAYIAGVAVASHPFLTAYESSIMPESLFTFLVVGFTFHVLRGMEKRSLLAFCLAGLYLGMSVLTRPVGFGALVIAPVVLLRSEDRRRSLIGLIVLGFVTLLVLAPWVARNRMIFGWSGLSAISGGINLYHSTGINLYHRTQELLATMDPNEVPREADHGFRRAILFAAREARTKGMAAIWPVYTEMASSGLSDVERDQVFLRIGLSAIREHPVAYLWGSLRRIKGVWSGYNLSMLLPGLQGAWARPLRANYEGGEFGIVGLKMIFQVAMPGVLIMLAIVGLVPRDNLGLFCALLAASLTIIPALLLAGDTRFRIPVEPFVVILAVRGLSRLLGGRVERLNNRECADVVAP